MAPMAGGVADGQEDRLVFLTRLLKRFLAPRIPVDGVIGVLPQIGRGFVEKPVRLPPFRVGRAHGERLGQSDKKNEQGGECMA